MLDLAGLSAVSKAPKRDLRTNPDTQEKILAAAERLFMEQGFTATSLRQITTVANVNLAAVNYHFGSKSQLIQAIFARRLGVLREQQLQTLDALESAHPDGKVPLEPLLHAFVWPSLKMSRDQKHGGAIFVQLLGRTFSKPAEYTRDVLPAPYAEVLQRYQAALARTLPHLPVHELAWRMHFMLGALAYTLSGSDAVELLHMNRASTDSIEQLTKHLVNFIAYGLQGTGKFGDKPETR